MSTPEETDLAVVRTQEGANRYGVPIGSEVGSRQKPVKPVRMGGQVAKVKPKRTTLLSPETQNKIKEYQRKNGLAQTGQLDAETVASTRLAGAENKNKKAAAKAAAEAERAASKADAARRRAEADARREAADKRRIEREAEAKVRRAEADKRRAEAEAARIKREQEAAAAKTAAAAAREASAQDRFSRSKASSKTISREQRDAILRQKGVKLSHEIVRPVDIDLAARNGHHIPGTAYHWWHGWRPRDISTARQHGKKFDPKKITKFFHPEPEEFNEATKTTPKFIASAKPKNFVDDKPVMKYHGSKILTGANFIAKDGKVHTVAKVSESKTHVLDTTGTKHRIADITPFGSGAEKFSAFQAKKQATAVKDYGIKSSFSEPVGEIKLPADSKAATSGVAMGNAIPGNYEIAAGHHAEPHFPKTASRSSLNVKEPLTPQQHKAVNWYTGSGSSSINESLRHGNGTDPNIAKIDAAMLLATPFNEPGLILHRGVDVEAINQLQAGESFIDKGFSSTSRRSDFSMALRTTRLHITGLDPAVKGLDVDHMSEHKGENEILLDRNTHFTVLQRVEHGNHVHLYVHARPATAEELAEMNGPKKSLKEMNAGKAEAFAKQHGAPTPEMVKAVSAQGHGPVSVKGKGPAPFEAAEPSTKEFLAEKFKTLTPAQSGAPTETIKAPSVGKTPDGKTLAGDPAAVAKTLEKLESEKAVVASASGKAALAFMQEAIKEDDPVKLKKYAADLDKFETIHQGDTAQLKKTKSLATSAQAYADARIAEKLAANKAKTLAKVAALDAAKGGGSYTAGNTKLGDQVGNKFPVLAADGKELGQIEFSSPGWTGKVDGGSIGFHASSGAAYAKVLEIQNAKTTTPGTGSELPVGKADAVNALKNAPFGSQHTIGDHTIYVSGMPGNKKYIVYGPSHVATHGGPDESGKFSKQQLAYGNNFGSADGAVTAAKASEFGGSPKGPSGELVNPATGKSILPPVPTPKPGNIYTSVNTVLEPGSMASKTLRDKDTGASLGVIRSDTPKAGQYQARYLDGSTSVHTSENAAKTALLGKANGAAPLSIATPAKPIPAFTEGKKPPVVLPSDFFAKGSVLPGAPGRDAQLIENAHKMYGDNMLKWTGAQLKSAAKLGDPMAIAEIRRRAAKAAAKKAGANA